jgi:ribosomal protein S18 acetylase RimI-like enzyme
LTVLPIEPAQYASAGRLVVAAYQAIPGNHMSGGYTEQLADVARRAVEAEVYVAVEVAPGGRLSICDESESETVVGCVTFVPDEHCPWAELLEPGEASIRMLAVDPAVQGRGVGQILLDACLDRARELGRDAVFLHSTEFMESAHRLYLRAGFVREPDRDWSPVPGVQLLAFRLPLI